MTWRNNAPGTRPRSRGKPGTRSYKVCPRCKSRATKLICITASSESCVTCQVCGHQYGLEPANKPAKRFEDASVSIPGVCENDENNEPAKMPAMRWLVECWNCGGEGLLENECPDDDCEFYTCDICEGKGSFVVTQLTEDNCDTAVPIYE